jgi:hypothetical protein
MLMMLLVITCLVAACGDDSGAENRRLVEQDRLDNPLVPLEHVDSAVQTEAVAAMSTINRQVNLKAASGGNKQAFYNSIQGRLNSASLKALGLTETSLTGSFYVATDYSISISGNQMTITAAEKGTRGRVEPQTFRVP